MEILSLHYPDASIHQVFFILDISATFNIFWQEKRGEENRLFLAAE